MPEHRPAAVAPPRIDQPTGVAAWMARLEPTVRAQIEDCDDLPPRPPLPAGSDYLAATRSNERGRTDREWAVQRRDLARLAARRLARGATDEPDDRLLDWLWDYLTAGSWAVAAHVPGRELPSLRRPTIDLAACEMAMAMAELREQLRPWIDAVSPSLADSIAAEIERRAFEPFERGDEHAGWSREDHVRNNWTGVCAGSLLAAACSLERQGLPHPATKAKASRLLGVFLERAFTPDGECDEGTGYWSYGLGFCCLGLMGLEPAERDAVIDRERLARVADYPRRAHLFDDTFYAANDAGDRMRPALAWVPWLAAETGNHWLAAWAAARGVGGPGKGLVPWRVAALPAADPAAWPGPAASLELDDQQARAVATDRILATIGGGHNGENHNHNDVGHVNVYLDREPRVLDLGAPHYVSDFFSDRRYTYLSANSRGHNVPEVAGELQRTAGDAAAEVVAAEPYTLEAAAAYPASAGLRSWQRSLATDGEAAVVDDRFHGRPGGDVVLRWWLAAEPVITDDAVLAGGLIISCDAGGPWAIEAITSADHLLRCAERHPRLWAVTRSLKLDEQGTARAATRFSVAP